MLLIDEGERVDPNRLPSSISSNRGAADRRLPSTVDSHCDLFHYFMRISYLATERALPNLKGLQLYKTRRIVGDLVVY